MKDREIIKYLVTDRENTLSVRKITVNKAGNSLGNPAISVGTLPYYEWSKDRQITFVLTYGRYLNCELLVYDKQIKKDGDYVFATGIKEATKVLTELINKAKN